MKQLICVFSFVFCCLQAGAAIEIRGLEITGDDELTLQIVNTQGSLTDSNLVIYFGKCVGKFGHIGTARCQLKVREKTAESIDFGFSPGANQFSELQIVRSFSDIEIARDEKASLSLYSLVELHDDKGEVVAVSVGEFLASANRD